MITKTKRNLIKEGKQDYQDWKESLTDTPEKAAKYKKIAEKNEKVFGIFV